MRFNDFWRKQKMQQEAYNHKTIEKKWQKYWDEHQTFKTDVWDFPSLSTMCLICSLTLQA